MLCGPRQPGAVQITMQELAAKRLTTQILPPPISRSDFDKGLARQRPTVSKADLKVQERVIKAIHARSELVESAASVGDDVGIVLESAGFYFEKGGSQAKPINDDGVIEKSNLNRLILFNDWNRDRLNLFNFLTVRHFGRPPIAMNQTILVMQIEMLELDIRDFIIYFAVEMRKRLEGTKFTSGEIIGIEAVIGLNAVLSLDWKKDTIFVDEFLVYQLLTRRLQIGQSKMMSKRKKEASTVLYCALLRCFTSVSKNEAPCSDYKRSNPDLAKEDVMLKSLATKNLWHQRTKSKDIVELAEGRCHVAYRFEYTIYYIFRAILKVINEKKLTILVFNAVETTNKIVNSSMLEKNEWGKTLEVSDTLINAQGSIHWKGNMELIAATTSRKMDGAQGREGQHLVYLIVIQEKRIMKKNNQQMFQSVVEWLNVGTDSVILEDYSNSSSRILVDP